MEDRALYIGDEPLWRTEPSISEMSLYGGQPSYIGDEPLALYGGQSPLISEMSLYGGQRGCNKMFGPSWP